MAHPTPRSGESTCAFLLQQCICSMLDGWLRSCHGMNSFGRPNGPGVCSQLPPFCRMVLGLLPSLNVALPDDPPSIRHSVSCLLEAVQVNASTPGDVVAPQSHPLTEAGQQRRQEAGPEAGPAVALRMTVFAAGGWVGGWAGVVTYKAVSLQLPCMAPRPAATTHQCLFPHPRGTARSRCRGLLARGAC